VSLTTQNNELDKKQQTTECEDIVCDAIGHKLVPNAVANDIKSANRRGISKLNAIQSQSIPAATKNEDTDLESSNNVVFGVCKSIPNKM
jgi:hypothetical protein